MDAMDLPEVSCSEQAGVRYLHLGDTPWVQGCMRVRKPFAIELEYVQRMLAWLLWRDPHDADMLRGLHAVQLGLGAASLTKFCARVLHARTTAVEINEQVITVGRTWFALPPDDARLRVLCADALAWVQAAEQAETVDALMVDVYDQEAAGPVLDSPAFYAHCHQALRAGGMMSVNLFGRSSSFARSLQRISVIFGAEQVWHFKPTREGNAIVLAGKEVSPLKEELLQARCVALGALWGLKTNTWLKALKSAAKD